jgi:RimJ/RimL family protein N-acetyltransferase
VRITGEAVVLEPLVADDAGDLAGLLAEPALREWLRADDLDGLRDRFAGWETRRSPDERERWLNWVVRARADRRALGWIQATVRGDAAIVGYATLPAERGAGAASDALRALTAWLCAEVETITAEIADDNAASARVVAAAGFERTDRRSGGEAVWELDRAEIARSAGRSDRAPR